MTLLLNNREEATILSGCQKFYEDDTIDANGNLLNDGEKSYEASHALTDDKDGLVPVVFLDYIVEASHVLNISLEGIDVPLRPFGLAEPFELDGVAGDTVFDKEARDELPVIAVAAEAVDHEHHGSGGRAAPLPVENAPLFAFFHVYFLLWIAIALGRYYTTFRGTCMFAKSPACPLLFSTTTR